MRSVTGLYPRKGKKVIIVFGLRATELNTKSWNIPKKKPLKIPRIRFGSSDIPSESIREKRIIPPMISKDTLRWIVKPIWKSS